MKKRFLNYYFNRGFNYQEILTFLSLKYSYATEHIIEDDSSGNNDFQDYFDKARASLSISLPKSWEETPSLYKKTNAHCCSW